jgi:hypothetical protein
MAAKSKDPYELFKSKIEEAIEDLDKDSVAEDISNNVDWEELAKEVMAEDADLRQKLKNKLAQLIGEKIDEAESFEDLTGDDEFDFLQHLPEGEEIGDFVSGLLEQGQPLRKKLEEKLIELVSDQISNASDFEELTGDEDFRWFDNLPDDFSLSKIIAELIESDKELKDKLRAKLRDLVIEDIDEKMDTDDIPDWSDLLEMLDVEETIRQLAKEDSELKEKLLKEIRTLIENKIENELDEDSLPDDLLEKMDLSTEVKLVLADRDFRDQISAQLQKMIREYILQTVNQGNLGTQLAEKVKENPEFSTILDRQVNDMMRNPDLITSIKSTIKERLTSDPEVGQKIMGAVFEEVARSIVAKLFKGY